MMNEGIEGTHDDQGRDQVNSYASVQDDAGVVVALAATAVLR